MCSHPILEYHLILRDIQNASPMEIVTALRTRSDEIDPSTQLFMRSVAFRIEFSKLHINIERDHIFHVPSDATRTVLRALEPSSPKIDFVRILLKKV